MKYCIDLLIRDLTLIFSDLTFLFLASQFLKKIGELCFFHDPTQTGHFFSVGIEKEECWRHINLKAINDAWIVFHLHQKDFSESRLVKTFAHALEPRFHCAARNAVVGGNVEKRHHAWRWDLRVGLG